MRTSWIAAALACLVVAGTATALHTTQAPGPEPGPDDLGVSSNDVREEPSHPDDDNHIPGDHPGPFFSPGTRTLVLDAFVAQGATHGHRADVDADNVVNRALHGSDYGDHERTMYPGVHRYAAWWGWWIDTGGGGDLQEEPALHALPNVGPANGAIDDAPDCQDRPWDEWTHRGPHPCPDQVPRPAYPDDQMFAFVQPGTHRFYIDSTLERRGYGRALDARADGARQPDFPYRSYHERWEEPFRFADLEYDASLLVTTKVTSAANPREVHEGAYDPHAPSAGLEDPDRDHAVDVDLYTSPSPLVERAYRTFVWDPGDAAASPADALHPEGPKAWAKEEVPATIEATEASARQTVAQGMETAERQRGFADDLVQGPFLQEPNTPGDVYGVDTTGSPADWATHDPATTYGGLDGDYFEPGPDQAHGGYGDGERFWADLQPRMYYAPVPASVGLGAQWTPEVPSTSSPAASTAREGDDDTQGPGFLYLEGAAGTWHDANGDGWVGDAGEDGHPYDNGTTEDPHDYASDEFRGACDVDVNATLYPTTDTDGDGVKDWGAAGVYVIAPRSPTYGAPWMDALGHAADPLLEPIRENVRFSWLLVPERDRLEQHRQTGPIDLDVWICPASTADEGAHHGWHWILLPTGTLDFGFRAVTQARLTDELRVSQHGDNQGDSLTGQSVVDVDRVDPMVRDLG